MFSDLSRELISLNSVHRELDVTSLANGDVFVKIRGGQACSRALTAFVSYDKIRCKSAVQEVFQQIDKQIMDRRPLRLTNWHKGRVVHSSPATSPKSQSESGMTSPELESVKQSKFESNQNFRGFP